MSVDMKDYLAYQEGYEAGKHDAAAAIEALQAQLPKRGEWEKEETGKGIFKQIIYKCSICGRYLDFDGVNAGRGDANYCPCCGAKMEVQE